MSKSTTYYYSSTFNKPKLKPCPFCGGEDIKIIDGYGNVGCWATCVSCGATAGAEEQTHKQAIGAWNRRPK